MGSRYVAQAGFKLWAQVILPPQAPEYKCTVLRDSRCTPTDLANFKTFCRGEGLPMLPRLILNSWPQAIFLPQSPKVLRLKA